jgi:hypothetical protein
MIGLETKDVKDVMPPSANRKSVLLLALGAQEYFHFSTTSPPEVDPRLDFPGFDLREMAKGIQPFLANGESAKWADYSEEKQYREVLGHLWQLNSKRTKGPERSERIVEHRPAHSTPEREVFFLGQIADRWHRANDAHGHYPFLLSPHSGPYWKGLHLLATVQAWGELTRDKATSCTGMSLVDIDEGISILNSGFMATSATGDTRPYKADLTEKENEDGKLRLPEALLFKDEPDLDLGELDPEDASPHLELVGVQAEAEVVFVIRGRLAVLITARAKDHEVSPETAVRDLLAPRLAQIEPMLEDEEKHRATERQRLWDEAKSKLDEEYELKLAALAKKMGFDLPA